MHKGRDIKTPLDDKWPRTVVIFHNDSGTATLRHEPRASPFGTHHRQREYDDPSAAMAKSEALPGDVEWIERWD